MDPLGVLVIAAGWGLLLLAFLGVDKIRERRRERRKLGDTWTE